MSSLQKSNSLSSMNLQSFFLLLKMLGPCVFIAEKQQSAVGELTIGFLLLKMLGRVFIAEKQQSAVGELTIGFLLLKM